MEIQQKAILLIEESEPMLFSTQEKLATYLLSNSDEEMNESLVEMFLKERIASTSYASYTWDWLTIDDKVKGK